MPFVRRLSRMLAAAVLAVGLGVWTSASQSSPAQPAPATLPTRLSDQQFWKLSSDLSEPNGTFRSENLVSNEHTYQYVVPVLARTVKPGTVYLGVAPDQNFTYMVATEPRMAFIIDIRRGNLLEHLLYKALFELSADRADFVGRLFSKRRPEGLTSNASIVQIFGAYDRVATSEELYTRNLQAVLDLLTRTHGFPLTAADRQQIETIYFAFFWDGPGIRYSNSTAGPGRRGNNISFPSFEELAMQTDWEGVHRGYLANEDAYRIVKSLEEKNLIVPVVGNFAGPKALRAVGRYVRERGGTVGAFYVSNVEQYLFQDGLFADFARNVSTLPIDASSVFIRSVSSSFGFKGMMLGPDGRASAVDHIQPFIGDFQDGRIQSYYDVNSRSR